MVIMVGKISFTSSLYAKTLTLPNYISQLLALANKRLCQTDFARFNKTTNEYCMWLRFFRLFGNYLTEIGFQLAMTNMINLHRCLDNIVLDIKRYVQNIDSSDRANQEEIVSIEYIVLFNNRLNLIEGNIDGI